MRSIFVLFVSLVLVFSIDAQNSAKTAFLVDSFERIQCEDARARMDNFMAELANSPKDRGVIVIHLKSADPLWAFRQLQEYLAQARFRSFDMNRLDAKVGPERSASLIEFWRVPPGADGPQPKDTDRDPESSKPTVMKAVQFGTTVSSEEAGCVSMPFDLEAFALALKNLDGVRGRMTATGPNANRSLKKMKEFLDEMRVYGLEEPAVRAKYVKGPKDVTELWIEPTPKSKSN